MKLLGVIGGPEIIVILLIVLVLFGGKKIPELMKECMQKLRIWIRKRSAE